VNESFERLLHEADIPCRVEAHDRLAVIIPGHPPQLVPATRARIIELAMAAGFTHVAVEIVPPDAALPGD
jgi:hypothetical protein